MRTLLALVLGIAAAWLGNSAGDWWATFAVGFALGIVLTWAFAAIVAGAIVGVVAWTLPLVWAGASHPVLSAAVAISKAMGYPAAGAAPALAITLLTGLLLGFSGAWLGAAGRALLVLRRRPAA